MGRLKRKLQSSLHMMTMLADGIPGTEMYMGHLAKVHDRYHIPPEFFEIWLDVLIDAVKQFDTEFNDEVEAAWRKVIGKGIEIMSAGKSARVLDI
jgi:truncated hemoglobin YjbI